MNCPSAIFLGSKAFGLAILRALIVSAPDVIWQIVHPDDTADGRSALDVFRVFCRDRDMPLTVVDGAAQANSLLEEASAGLIMVCGWYHLIPEKVLSSGARVVGIHNSLLPTYRGGAPLVWAMINGESRVGSTLFRITPGLDDGPIYLQVATAPEAEDTIADVLAELEAVFLAALLRCWPALVTGEDEGRQQDHTQATYCGQRVARDGRIDWSLPARRIHDFVRAQSRPYPGAYGTIGDRIVRIWRTRPVDVRNYGTPGQVLSRGADKVAIACGGATCIEVLEADDATGATALRQVFNSLSLRLG